MLPLRICSRKNVFQAELCAIQGAYFDLVLSKCHRKKKPWMCQYIDSLVFEKFHLVLGLLRRKRDFIIQIKLVLHLSRPLPDEYYEKELMRYSRTLSRITLDLKRTLKENNHVQRSLLDWIFVIREIIFAIISYSTFILPLLAVKWTHSLLLSFSFACCELKWLCFFAILDFFLISFMSVLIMSVPVFRRYDLSKRYDVSVMRNNWKVNVK